MVKNEKDYKRRKDIKCTLGLRTDTPFTEGKRKGWLSIEDEMVIFKEIISASRKRSKRIVKTDHFSVLERPDGSIAGTFHFKAKGKRLRGQLSAEFWQAITLAFKINDKTEQDEKK